MESQHKVRQVMKAELSKLSFEEILKLPLNDVMQIARKAGIPELSAMNYVRGYIHGGEKSIWGFFMN